ncbi:hypothetical protein F511_30217, partial [Dorcoceras hygrometricum]
HHEKSSLTPEDVGFRINVHYGIPSTASILAFDPIQRLLAVGTHYVGDEYGLMSVLKYDAACEQLLRLPYHLSLDLHSVSTSAQVEGPWCEAVINLHKSGVQDIKFTNEGTKLIVGYEFAKIAVLDLNSWSLTLTRDSISSHTLVSVLWEASVYGSIKNTNEIGPIIPNSHSGELVFVLTKNANIYVINANTGSLINSRPLHLKRESSAISMYIIETHRQYSHSANDEQILKDDPVTKDHSQNEKAQGSEKCESDTDASDKTSPGELMKEFLFLLCCEDALRIYPANSVINGENKYIHKIKLAKPCCWTSLLRKEGKVCGLVIIYKTGEIEIRSVTDLKMVKEYSLMSDLRWNFQSNMERTFSSTANGQITMGMNPGILDAFKGLKRKKSSKLGDIFTPKYELSHLEDIFRRNPFLESSMTTSEQEAHELTIDDIEIDELLPSESSLSREVVKRDKDKKTEREKLFDGDADVKPKVRTREEIEAIYRTGDASSVAGEARNKLLERQQKLEKTKRQTEELQNEAKEFASLTDELVKAMENRKWYHI